MKKYLFVYDAKTRGGRTVGNVAMGLESLTMEAIREVQRRAAEGFGEGASVIVTNVIELEG